MKKKKKIKWRNGIAKALQSPSFKPKVIQNKKKKKVKVFIDIEVMSMDEWWRK